MLLAQITIIDLVNNKKLGKSTKNITNIIRTLQIKAL